MIYGKRFSEESIVDDAIHDLFVRLWEKREQLNVAANPRPYLLISLRNDLLRANKAAGRITEFEHDESVSTPSFEADLSEQEQRAEQETDLSKALMKLSAREKELVNLRFKQDLSYEEIVAVTGISYQSARNTLARAIAKLRGSLTTIFFLILSTKGLLYTYILESF